MYSVSVRAHIMIAHSIPDKVFGPAQNLHGATYVIDAEFQRVTLDTHNLVIDIDLATRALQEAGRGLNYRNLDELPQFNEVLTTTEYLAKYLHDQIRSHLGAQFSGVLKVCLAESHVASASYQGPEK